MVNKLFSFFFVFVLFGVFSPVSALAATINATPDSASHTTGNTFSVDVLIDGANQAFNASRATVMISENLTVNDLILGDCNFSFVKTPTIADPSFIGVILGDTMRKCTLYTLKLTPLSQGTGQITFLDASVKRATDALEILTSVQNGSYILSGASITPTVTPTPLQAAATNYAVSLKIYSQNDQPVEGATVILTPQDQESGQAPVKTKTDTTGVAGFIDVPEGMSVVTVEHDGKRIAENVINFSGENPAMVLSIKEQQEPVNWLMVTLIILSILGILVIIVIRFRKLKKASS